MSILLKTLTHEKLPKGSSHPASTEKLSEALQGVPQFDELQIHFHAEEGRVLGENHRIHGAASKQLDGYRLFLEVRWSQEQGWGIDVFSVPSQRKPMIVSACASRGFPELRKWLEAKRPESWFIGTRFFQVAVSEFTDELAIREIHNEHVEAQQEFLEGAAGA